MSPKRAINDEEDARIQRMIAGDPDAPEATDEQIAQRQPFTEADPDLAEAMWRKQVADEDDAPDLSTPYWQERFAKVKVRRGRPKDGSGDT